MTVPLTASGVQGAPAGVRPMIRVRVGNGPTIPVLLDTGSVGLHVYAPGVTVGSGGGVVVTHRRDSITYAIGARQTGVIANAKVTIGGVTTTRPIPFGLITSLSCIAGKPSCPRPRRNPRRGRGW